MILLGCLLALGIAVAPRAVLGLAWIFSDRWDIVWGGDWIAPLLGIIFLPFTTIMYLLSWKPTGIEGWDWLWIILGLLMDVMHWGQAIQNRKQVPGYPAGSTAVTASGSSGAGTSTAASYAPASTTTRPPTAAPVVTTPVVPPAADATPTAPPAAAPPLTGSDLTPLEEPSAGTGSSGG